MASQLIEILITNQRYHRLMFIIIVFRDKHIQEHQQIPTEKLLLPSKNQTHLTLMCGACGTLIAVQSSKEKTFHHHVQEFCFSPIIFVAYYIYIMYRNCDNDGNAVEFQRCTAGKTPTNIQNTYTIP